MINMQSARASRLCRLGILTVFLFTLAACSATGIRTKAYDGPDLPSAQTATLKAPSTIKVLSINGHDTTPFMLEDVALNFSIKPGSNDVVFRYRSIWAKKGVRDNGDSAVSVIESEVRQASFNARAGETYAFAYDSAGNVRQARRLAQGFSARIINEAGETVAQSTIHRARQQQARSSDPDTRTSPADGVSVSGRAQDSARGLVPDMSTLDALNLLWQRATREEKEAFLRRAFEAAQ